MIDRLRSSPVSILAPSAAALLLFALLGANSLSSRKAVAACYSNTSFYLIFALVILWIVLLICHLRQLRVSVGGFLRRQVFGIVLALLVTALIFLTVPVYLKILNDETNLLAVSQAMLYFRSADRIAMATFFDGGLQVLSFEVPIRPTLFPFLTWLLHAVFGYHPHNAFVVNFLLAFVFLAGVYICTRKFTDVYASCAATLLVAATPIFSICATSGGYDLLATALFFLSLVLLYQYLQSPGPTGFAFLTSTLLMLANVRNESIALSAVIFLGAAMAKRHLYWRQLLPLYAAAPLFMLPYVWQRVLSAGEYENPQGVALFGLQSLTDHLWIVIQNFLTFDFYLPYAGFLNGLAVAIFIYLCGQLALKNLRPAAWQAAFWRIAGGCILLHTAVSLAHFMGLYDHPAQARFFLNLSVACALAPVVLQSLYPARIPGKVVLIFAVAMFALYHPVATGHKFVDSLMVSRSHRAEIQFLKELNSPDILVLSAYPTQFSALGYSSVSIRYANQHRSELRAARQKGRFSRSFAFQHISSITRKPVFDTQVLATGYRLHPLKCIPVLKNVELKISEVDFH